MLMDVIINSECQVVPEQNNEIPTAGNALLYLLNCLGYDPHDPPLADLLRKFHHLEGDWLLLSPVNWQATHNDAFIAAVGKELQWSEAEAKSWFEIFEDYFATEGMSLYYHEAENWLLHDPLQRPLKAKPVYQLLGKSLMPELAQLDQDLFWQKFFTETQMLLASRPHHSLVNGMWPWGNAKLDAKKSKAICVDDYFLPVAQQCSANVTLYNPKVKLKEYSILLFNEFSTLSQEHQEELKKLPVQWYWNNTMYSSNNNKWYKRLWRKLFHAN